MAFSLSGLLNVIVAMPCETSKVTVDMLAGTWKGVLGRRAPEYLRLESDSSSDENAMGDCPLVQQVVIV